MTEADIIIIATAIVVVGVLIGGVIGNAERSDRNALKRIGARPLGMDRSGMPVSDLDIRRTAHLFIQLRGDEATARTHKMVERMRSKGDHDVIGETR